MGAGMKIAVSAGVALVLAHGAGGIAGTGMPASTGAAVVLGERMAAQRGWTGSQWRCLNALWTRESGWSYTAVNPRSGAYGIPQSLPADKMAAAGADWQSSAATQIRWGLRYIGAVYGTPCGAWSHETGWGWY